MSAWLLLGSVAAFAQPAPEPIPWIIQVRDTNSQISYQINTREAVVTNGVIVTYSNTVLTANFARLNEVTGDVQAEGGVRVLRAGEAWTGEKLRYNFRTREISGEEFRTGQPPFFAAGDVLMSDPATKVNVAANGRVTSDDYADPGYWVRAQTLVIVPGDYVEAKNATLMIGKIPVMWLPYFKRHFQRHPNNFAFLPGYRSLYGPYLYSEYNFTLSDKFDGTAHLDTYQKRGFGYGPDFNYHLGRIGEGTIKYWRIDDEHPGLAPDQLTPIPEERQRLGFTHQAAITSNLTVKAAVRYQSDPFVVRDFYESEYRRNVQPSSFVEVNQLWRNFSLDVLGQSQVNQFYETVERGPDVKLTGMRQQIGVTPLFYESDSSFGYYRRRFADGDTNNAYAAQRADTYHQITLPHTLFGFLNVAPRVGGRFTHYGETDGPGSTLTEKNRRVFNTGMELSLKASRVWGGVRNKFWDVDGLRHIVEPSVNYVYVPRPNRSPGELPQFDYELPGTRLLPIEYPDYNAVDSIDSQNVIRWGLRNKLQTKRRDGVENLVNWALYTDWRLRPRPGQSTFADVYSDLDLKPWRWLTLNSETRFNVANREWREANHSVIFAPNDTWSWAVGHRYLKNDPTFGPDYGNNLVTSRIYYRLNENWGLRVAHHFEGRDGRMEEQYYSVYRDLRSWTSALTFRIREQRVGGQTDYTIAVSISLKTFPRFKEGYDSDRPSLLLGG